MSLDVLATLRAARDLLSDPARWTQGTTARDARGRELLTRLCDEGYDYAAAENLAAMHSDAVCWCLGGALERAAGEPIRFDDTRMRILWDRLDGNVGPWNDRHTHVEVLAVLDEAIALASRET